MNIPKLIAIIGAGIAASLLEYYGAKYLFPNPNEALMVLAASYGIARVFRVWSA